MGKEIAQLNSLYHDLKRPESLVKNMTYDEFTEWLDKGTKKDLECTLEAFEKSGLQLHCQIIKLKMKRL